jgi:hypothetical protein
VQGVVLEGVDLPVREGGAVIIERMNSTCGIDSREGEDVRGKGD